jgi:hypothetical protein
MSNTKNIQSKLKIAEEQLKQAKKRQGALPNALIQANNELQILKKQLVQQIYNFHITKVGTWDEVSATQERIDQLQLLIKHQISLEAMLTAEVGVFQGKINQLKPQVSTITEPIIPNARLKRYEDAVLALRGAKSKGEFRELTREVRISATDSVLNKGWEAEEIIADVYAQLLDKESNHVEDK